MEYRKEMRKVIGKGRLLLCGAGCLIFNENNEVLLQKRSDDGLWGSIGGSIDLGEDIYECAKREVLEEAGLIVDNLEIFGIYSGEEQHHIYPNGDECYFVSIMFRTNDYKIASKELDGESLEHKFFRLDELPNDVNKLFIPVKRDLEKII